MMARGGKNSMKGQFEELCFMHWSYLTAMAMVMVMVMN